MMFATAVARRAPFARRTFASSAAQVASIFNASINTSACILAVATAAVVVSTRHPTTTYNHCQVPCGIFDDPAMVSAMLQDATTIRKAMDQSSSLHGSGGLQSMNQIVRWIQTKEEHCDKIIKTVGEYCLCQRVKKPAFASLKEYYEALELHHSVMQAAMKAKQTMDPAACDALDHAISDLAKMYTK